MSACKNVLSVSVTDYSVSYFTFSVVHRLSPGDEKKVEKTGSKTLTVFCMENATKQLRFIFIRKTVRKHNVFI